jgi:immunity protein 53 of polymorphic toxin system
MRRRVARRGGEPVGLPGELEALQRWYLSQCNGDWEHTYGVDIGTLDNPGWTMAIHVAETELSGQPFERLEITRSETDWLVCWVGIPELVTQTRAEAFQAACGPQNLAEVIGLFLRWAEGTAP